MSEGLAAKMDAFFPEYPIREYHRGQILIYDKDIVQQIFFLFSGKVRQYRIADEGNEVVVETFHDNSFFPSLSNYFSKTPSDFFYDATTDIRIKAVPMSRVIELLKTQPETLIDLVIHAQEAMENSLKRMSHVMSSTAYYRLTYELLLECELASRDRRGQYRLSLHEYELANQAGVSRETASRELQKLKRKGMVAVNKQYIVVKDVIRLRKELGDHL